MTHFRPVAILPSSLLWPWIFHWIDGYPPIRWRFLFSNATQTQLSMAPSYDRQKKSNASNRSEVVQYLNLSTNLITLFTDPYPQWRTWLSFIIFFCIKKKFYFSQRIIEQKSFRSKRDKELTISPRHIFLLEYYLFRFAKIAVCFQDKEKEFHLSFSSDLWHRTTD